MTNVKPIRQKSLWAQYDMLSMILKATEELLPHTDPDDYAEIAADLAENRLAQQRLRARAEMLEGVRHAG